MIAYSVLSIGCITREAAATSYIVVCWLQLLVVYSLVMKHTIIYQRNNRCYFGPLLILTKIINKTKQRLNDTAINSNCMACEHCISTTRPGRIAYNGEIWLVLIVIGGF